MTLTECLERLESFVKLEPNWDSYDAAVISVKAVEMARAVLREIDFDLYTNVTVVPMPDGGVQIDCDAHTEGQYCLEIECHPNGKFGMLDGGTVAYKEYDEIESVDEVVSRLAISKMEPRRKSKVDVTLRYCGRRKPLTDPDPFT